MGTIILRNFPNEILRFELPEVVSDPIEIKIHMVRVYNDGKTIISILNLKTDKADYYYATITNATTSPAKEGQYLGYLIRRNDNGDSSSVADSKKTKQRIENIFKKLNVFDKRLPEEFKKGGFNTQGHNGLRIFQNNMPYKEFEYWTRLNGGNRFFHVANYADQVIGCEGVGLYASIDQNDAYYGVWKSKEATADFLNNIITVYEENLDRKEQSTIHIDIEVEDNIQATIKRGDKLNPKNLYNKLYPPREKEEALKIEPIGIKSVKIETKNIDLNKL